MILNEVWLYMSDVYLHDCTSRPHPLHVYSIRMFFIAFMKSIPFTHKFLSFVVDHNVYFERTLTWRNNNRLLGLQCSNSKATHPE